MVVQLVGTRISEEIQLQLELWDTAVLIGCYYYSDDNFIWQLNWGGIKWVGEFPVMLFIVEKIIWKQSGPAFFMFWNDFHVIQEVSENCIQNHPTSAITSTWVINIVRQLHWDTLQGMSEYH